MLRRSPRPACRASHLNPRGHVQVNVVAPRRNFTQSFTTRRMGDKENDAAACTLPPRAATKPAAAAPSDTTSQTSLAEVNDGRFLRKDSVYRNKIEKGGEFPPAGAGRYHLYVSLACPWAHRCLLYRKLKGLEKAIGMSVVEPVWGEQDPGVAGWVFGEKNVDKLNGLPSLRHVYRHFQPSHVGKVTTPLLVDTVAKKIVNNESSEIVSFFNSEFDEFAENRDVDLMPAALKTNIAAANELIYNTINNGVYRCGFATTQAAYEEAYYQLFQTLDVVEETLSKQRYLVSNTVVTESDLRLFATLIRFDAVYVSHFKTNKKRIVDYPNLLGFVRDLYQYRGIGDTVDFEHIKNHYFRSHPSINPHRIVPIGPELPDYKAPHGRERFAK